MSGCRLFPLESIIALFCILILGAPISAQLSDEDIAALRDRGERDGWTFTVTKNPATEIPLSRLAAAKEPVGWRDLFSSKSAATQGELPQRYDWREVTGCPPIRNQGSCGSCWAFSTVGAMECNILIKDDKVVDLSEQWLVSCNTDGHSCDGGWYCFDYFWWKPDPCGGVGAVMETDFGYTAMDVPCDCPYPHKYFIETWDFVGSYEPDIPAIKQAIMDHGPVSVGVYAGDAMQSYGGGVFNVDVGDWTNHLVVLVGWDDTQGTEGVWIMRNSWGGGWGEDGYMRIEYGCSRIGYSAAYIEYRGVQRIGLGETDFSDALGDGDGVLEGGETIQLTCAVANLGPDPVTDVSVEMSIDDPSLTIVDDSSYLGTIPPGDSLANSGDPFQFDIPVDYISRIGKFTLAVTWNCGPGCDTFAVDTAVIEAAVGPTSILVVDDDAGDTLERYYQDCLHDWRIPSNTWPVDDTGDPAGTDLAAYDVVIWFTGDYRQAPLSTDGIAAMSDYLDSGGNLMLSGQGIAAQLGDPNPVPGNLSPDDMQAVTTLTPILSHDNRIPPFLQDYLKSEYLSTQIMPVLVSDSEGVILQPGDSIAIQGYGGASNQTHPDFISPVGDGRGELRYAVYDSRGCVSYTGAYKSVFLSFGFEAIISGNSRWVGRDTVMLNILNIFNYTMPDMYGKSFDNPLLSAAAAPGPHVDGNRGATDAITYAYQVYDDPGLTSLAASAEGHPEGAGGTTSWQVPVSLIEDEDYFWRVRADDPVDTGAWSDPAVFWVNATNQAPANFSLCLPENNSPVPDMWPTFVWSKSEDGDGFDAVTYTLYHGSDAAFLTADSICGLTDTVYTPPGPIDLGDATVCYWKVSARDLCGGETSCQQIFNFKTIIMGDANNDGDINIGDAVFLIDHIFGGGPAPDPESLGDADCNDTINIADPVYIINYIFKGGPPPGC